MRIIYIDIDSLRPDHLSCYGYHRRTSPNIDEIARRGVRFTNCYASDVPCLPSRTALFSGHFGIHNGVINHGGVASEPFIEGPGRGFRSALGATNWMTCLRNLGYRTATISSFGERHSAWHFYAGFSDIINPGYSGIDTADQVSPLAIDWIARHGRGENWFCHVNLWDPHTPYRAPDEFVEMFKDEPLPAWYTEDVRRAHWDGCGPHSAREVLGFDVGPERREYERRWPKQPVEIDTMEQARAMFDGYDASVRFADEHVRRILSALADLNVLDDTAVIVSADHGENLGELNIYCDHQTADQFTARVPLIVRWPGIPSEPRVENGLIYNLDFAATSIDLLGGEVPLNWDGQSFASELRAGVRFCRDHLVLGQGAWTCQRSVRFDDWLWINSFHDGYHAFPDVMLFNLRDDPHEQHDVAAENPHVIKRAMSKLNAWHDDMMRTSTSGIDPMETVLAEGGPHHAKGQLANYLTRLRATDRAQWAQFLEARSSETKDPRSKLRGRSQN
jgi:arylsulfatase A-like enzyme